jgi:hypothetical protein
VRSLRIFLIAAISSIALVSFVGADEGSARGDHSGVRNSEPRVICLNYSAGAFTVRSRPHRCDYYDAKAPDSPIVGLAIYPTRKVRWIHWGSKMALGRGQYHITGGWLKAKIRLTRPKRACGAKVVTAIQAKVKLPGKPWREGWGRPFPIKRCT